MYTYSNCFGKVKIRYFFGYVCSEINSLFFGLKLYLGLRFLFLRPELGLDSKKLNPYYCFNPMIYMGINVV